MIRIKRVYEEVSEADGFRVLVDRLWPRGLPKSKARVDLWMKDIAPSDKLRKWFAHDPEKWESFAEKYKQELRGRQGLLQKIKQIEKEKGTVTLLFSSKDRERNNAVALSRVLKR